MKSILVVFLSVLIGTTVQAQAPDSLKTKRLSTLTTQLAVSEKTAAKVDQVLSLYKKDAQLLIGKNSDQRSLRRGMDSLIALKNQKLASLLTKAQLAKLVPANELQTGK